MLSQYQSALRDRVSYLEQIDLRSLKNIILVIAGSFICILVMIFVVSGFISKDALYRWDQYRGAILFFYALVLYWLSINGYRQAQTIQFPKEVQVTEVTTRSDLAEAILTKMREDRVYRNPELSLADLSRAVGYSERSISAVLNGELGKNFYTFVNEHRVNDVKERLSDPANDPIRILVLAYEAGFNSKASFNRVFKELTGLTPNRFRSKVRK